MIKATTLKIGVRSAKIDKKIANFDKTPRVAILLHCILQRYWCPYNHFELSFLFGIKESKSHFDMKKSFFSVNYATSGVSQFPQ